MQQFGTQAPGHLYVLREMWSWFILSKKEEEKKTFRYQSAYVMNMGYEHGMYADIHSLISKNFIFLLRSSSQILKLNKTATIKNKLSRLAD